jgi:hypothetical protein
VLPEDAVVHREADQIVLRFGCVLVWLSRGGLEDAPLRRLREELETLAAEHAEGVALLLVAVGEGELPGLQRRRSIARGLSSLGDHLQCVAAAFEGEGRWVTRLSGVVEGILSMVTGLGGGLPMQAFSSREDAIVWMCGVARGPDERPLDSVALADFVDEGFAELTGRKSEP